MAKLPGKTAYSGVRRPMTRDSGFSSHPDSTGGKWKVESTQGVDLKAGEALQITFTIPKHAVGHWVAFGGWYCAKQGVIVEVNSPHPKYTLIAPSHPNWSKFGSMWQGDGKAVTATVTLKSRSETKISLWNVSCGLVEQPGCHTAGKFEVCTAPGYLTNLHQLSPEAHFWKAQGQTVTELVDAELAIELDDVGEHITLKTCNRCARFLPINIDDERVPLSFSNHCITPKPCSHSGFGKLKNADDGQILQLRYGYQLECRYCKKYCVNAAHNKNRTGAQMKEDGARRRHFELLVTELYQMSRQMAFKHKTGVELSDYIWKKFECKCFKCGTALPTVKSMALDHTRPLALLWPLDETATALCGPCNSSKSDRYPKDFYTPAQMAQLSKLTGIPADELSDPTPNMEVVEELSKRLDWLFDSFLVKPEMVRERDGKVTGELVIKALQKAFDASPGGSLLDLCSEYDRRRQGKT
jgi:5-methylcytosine-specific restriction endonuclease McrA